MDKNTELKITISETAAHLYTKNRRFSMHALALKTGISKGEILKLFPSRSSALYFFYESRMLLYSEQLIQINKYEEFTLQEKLSNLFLTLLSLFSDYKAFVNVTFPHFATAPDHQSSFESLFKAELKKIFNSDPNISASARFMINPIFHSAIFYQFKILVSIWLNDESELDEHSMALVDKWSLLQQEFLYTKIIDRSFDFGKFLLLNSPLLKIFK